MKKTLFHLALLTAVSILFFFFHLGSVGLMEPDEGRNAEVAREVLATGDWVTPHLDVVRCLDKPILFFWAAAISMKVFGVNEFAARFPSALAALIGVIAVYVLGRRMFGERAGLLSGLVLATSPLYAALGRTVIFDMLLSVFITLTMLFWYGGYTEEDPRRKRLFYLLSWAAMALAVLTKGPIGAVLPLGIAGLFLIATRSLARIREMELLRGPLLLLFISGPWYLLVSIRNPEYPYYFFVAEHLLRYTTTAFHRVKPFWYYLPVVAAGLLPWIFFLPSAVAQGMRGTGKGSDRERAGLLFSGIWAAVVFLFFTFSKAKMPMYILPMFPALALVLGKFWDDGIADRVKGAALFAPLALLLTVVCLLGGALAFPTGVVRSLQQRLGEHGTAEVQALLRTAGMTALVFTAASFSLLMLLRGKRALPFVIVAALSLLILAAGLSALRMNEPFRSSKALAERLLAERRPGDAVVAYGSFPSSLPFYLREQVPVAPGTYGILGSNFIAHYRQNYRGSHGSSLMSPDELKALLADRARRVYLVAREDDARLMTSELAAFGVPELLFGQGRTVLAVRRESP